MANNKLYENYLMHYRTKGSKNGYTKYPGKYTPIGEKARGLEGIQNWFNNNVTHNPAKEPVRGLESVARFYNGIMDSNKIKYPQQLEKRDPNKMLANITNPNKRQQEAEARRIKGGSLGTVTRDEAAKRARMQAAEQRRIAGGSAGMTRSANAKPILSGIQATGMKGVGAYNSANKKYPFDAEAYARRQESIKDLNRNAAEQRRIAGGNPYVNQREENRKAAEQRRIAGGSNGTVTTSEAARRANQSAAEARRIAGGSQGTITTAEAKRKNINDWYSNQVRGGNKSAAEARRIKGGTQGVTTTEQAAAEKAESEKKKRMLKKVIKALSGGHGISRFL